MKRYLVLFSVFFIGLFTFLTAVVFTVDPYGLFWDEFNNQFPRKTAASDKGRTIKTYQVEGRAIETLIVGNSRVEVGMPPYHNLYGSSVFNIGIPGAGILMQYDYGWHAVRSSKGVKRALIAVDFVDFLSKGGTEYGWQGEWQKRLRYRLEKGFDSLDNNLNRAKEFSGFIFSQDAVVDSILTFTQQDSYINALNYNGFNDGNLYIDLVKVEGYLALYQQKNQELKERLFDKNLKFNSETALFIILEKFISSLKSADVEVIIFINPYQKQYLDIVEQAGFAKDFRNWKGRINQIAKEYKVDFYDFSILSLPVKSIPPLSSNNPDDNQYFWEPAHYKKALGKLILDAIQDKNCNQKIGMHIETICDYQPSR